MGKDSSPDLHARGPPQATSGWLPVFCAGAALQLIHAAHPVADRRPTKARQKSQPSWGGAAARPAQAQALEGELRASRARTTGGSEARARHGLALPSRRSLLWRIFRINALALTAAVAVLALSPATVSWPITVGEALILAAGLLTLLIVNLLLMRRALEPLARLWTVMRSVDPLRPGQRIDVQARSIEVQELNTAFNAMLDRLEAERRASGRRVQAAQDAERRRLALELHDEVGQDLTALMLQLDVAVRTAIKDQRERLESCREAARECLDHIRAIARRLRPEALDDLGLRDALTRLCQRVARDGGLDVVRHFDGLPATLNADVQLVIYRVVQESLTNALRHSGASRVSIDVDAGVAGLTVSVEDNGVGTRTTPEGLGMAGMRDRAVLVGGTLLVGPGAAGGTLVRLDIPTAELDP